jgi:hypothetical protein
VNYGLPVLGAAAAVFAAVLVGVSAMLALAAQGLRNRAQASGWVGTWPGERPLGWLAAALRECDLRLAPTRCATISDNGLAVRFHFHLRRWPQLFHRQSFPATGSAACHSVTIVTRLDVDGGRTGPADRDPSTRCR